MTGVAIFLVIGLSVFLTSVLKVSRPTNTLNSWLESHPSWLSGQRKFRSLIGDQFSHAAHFIMKIW